MRRPVLVFAPQQDTATMRTPFSLLALTLALVVTLSACGSEDAAPPPAEREAVQVPIATAVAAPVGQSYRYSGTIRGAQHVPLSTKLMGRVTAVTVEAGERVQAGQTLARLRTQNLDAQRRQVEAELRAARAQLENAETNVQRIQTLYEQESATKKELDDITTQRDQAAASVDALESRLAEIEDMLTYATIDAPFSGVVAEKRTETGAVTAPGQPLFVLERLDVLKAHVKVPEQDINRFTEGDTVAVVVNALDRRTLRGIVSEVNPSASAPSRVFTVQVQLDAPAGVKPGMYAEVVLQRGTRSATTVPETALVERGQLTGLYAVTDDNRAVLRWVRTGPATDGQVEILSGLRGGERFIAAVQDGRLSDGIRVTAQ